MKKRDLAMKLCKEFPSYFQYCLPHTTRKPRLDQESNLVCEHDGVEYHFLDSENNFEKKREQGKFMQTMYLYGDYFGFSHNALEAAAKNRLAGIVTMEIEGVMVLKNTHLEPRYVLVLPDNKELYEERMKDSGYYTKAQISQALSRIEEYSEMNREHPGYFDSTIVCDDEAERYATLKVTVMDYLGLSPPNTTASHSSLFSKESTVDFVHTSKPASGVKLLSSEDKYARQKTQTPMSVSNAFTGAARSPTKGKQRESVSPAAAASFQRRYESTKAALHGITSSSEEQLNKIKTPNSLQSTGIPYTRAYEDLMNSSPNKKEIEHVMSDTGLVPHRISSQYSSSVRESDDELDMSSPLKHFPSTAPALLAT
jgi:guanylate kinase